MREMIVFLRCIICDLYQVFLAGNSVPVTLILMMVFVHVPTGITFSFLHPSCASMLWIEWFSFFIFLFFYFSLVVFDGLIITSLRVFVNTFLNFFFNIFVILRFMCIYFIIYLYFLLFSVNSFFISLQTVFCGL